MKYMGSKARHAKELLPIILAGRTEGQWYVEPFVGGANMIDKVDGNRIGADLHTSLIKLWQSVSEGWLPPEQVSEETYQDAKGIEDSALKGYVGFAMSFGGKWFGGYRRDSVGKRDYSLESHKNACKQFPNLHGVDFRHSHYQNLDIPPNSIIYCDPPYKDTTKYKDSFDHEAFYEWCIKKHEEGHQVFISEYSMPSDFVCIWSKKVNSGLDKNKNSKKAVEKLFTINTNRYNK